MAEQTEVGIVNGVPVSGTGEVPTLAPVRDQLVAAVAHLASVVTAIQLLDNAVGGNELQVDVVGALPAGSANIGDVDVLTLPALVAGSAVIGKVDHTSTGLGHGNTSVTTAGTDVALAGSTAAKWVTVQARTSNTARVAVGATGVDATLTTGNGILLSPGESITLPIDNLADVFVDSLVNGEGVRYVYGT